MSPLNRLPTTSLTTVRSHPNGSRDGSSAMPAVERDLRRRLLTTADGLAWLGFALVLAATVVAEAWEIRSLDPQREGNIFTWASSAAAAVAGAACVLHAIVLPARRRLYAALGALLLVFSADDLVQAHETVGWDVFERVGFLPESVGARIWPVVFFPALVVMACLVWRLSGAVGAELGRRLRLGLGLLVLAVVLEGLDVLARELSALGYRGPGIVLRALEEAAELSAVVLWGVTLAAVLLVDVFRLARGMAARPETAAASTLQRVTRAS